MTDCTRLNEDTLLNEIEGLTEEEARRRIE